jgi:hypothetical protein
MWWIVPRVADPRCAQFPSVLFVLLAASEDKHLASPVTGHLDGHVCRSPESEQAQPLPWVDLAEAQRVIADDASAKQGRYLKI